MFQPASERAARGAGGPRRWGGAGPRRLRGPGGLPHPKLLRPQRKKRETGGTPGLTAPLGGTVQEPRQEASRIRLIGEGRRVSPSPRIQVGREAPSGDQSQEPAGRARSPESPRPGPQILALWFQGRYSGGARLTPPPTTTTRPAQAGTNPNETRSQSRMGEEGALAGEGIFSPVALSRWFGVPGEQGPSTAAPYPDQCEHTGGPQRGQCILPGSPHALRSLRSRGCRQAQGSGWLGSRGPGYAAGAEGSGSPPRTGDPTAPQKAQRWKDPLGKESRKWPPICQ